MPKRTTLPPPTEEEILSYQNVPVTLAARYIGWGPPTLYRALQEGRAPFGFAVECKGMWAHNISPGLLIKYKHGDLPTYRLREIQELAVEGIERLLAAKREAISKAITSIA